METGIFFGAIAVLTWLLFQLIRAQNVKRAINRGRLNISAKKFADDEIQVKISSSFPLNKKKATIVFMGTNPHIQASFMMYFKGTEPMKRITFFEGNSTPTFESYGQDEKINIQRKATPADIKQFQHIFELLQAIVKGTFTTYLRFDLTVKGDPWGIDVFKEIMKIGAKHLMTNK